MAPATTPAAPGRLVLGTRGSPLARAQAGLVRDGLAAAHPGLEVAVEVIRTSGDRFRDRPLAAIGGKGLFTKEIEAALADGRIDVAVHSMKDLPTALADGMAVPCVLERADPRDVLIARDAKSLAELPAGARVGTVSLRRGAQVLSRRPDLRIVHFRGNVQTRLAKIDRGEAEATLLALAGLRRLGLESAASAVLGPDEMLPAVAQGAIGLECRADDARTRDLVAPLDHAASHTAVAAERALLAALEGDCRTPIAALATLAGGTLSLRAMVALPDGSARFDTRREGPAADAETLGRDAGAELRTRAGADFFAALGGG